jgi:diadenylate cyclase
MVGDKLDEVRLHLVGARSEIYALTPSLMSVTIDLSKAVAGKQTFLLTEENIKLPRGIQLLDIAPSSVELSLAALETREVLVKPQLVGNLPGKRKLKTVEIRPEIIRALVPATRNAGEFIGVTTTPIYLESITQDTVIYCKIIARPSIQPLDKRWPDVEVRISLLP